MVAQVILSTSAGSPIVALSGYGTAPGLLLSAPPVSFGTVDTGAGGKALTFTVSNSWDRPETITGSELPSPPFKVSGLPKAGTVLAPQQSITASVTFDPPKAGEFHSHMSISSDQGSVTLPVTGRAVSGKAVMVVTPRELNFGSVAVGKSATLKFSVSDGGNIFLIVTRAAPPAGVFSAPVPLQEGITLDPDTGVTQAVIFRPTSTGKFVDQYRLNGNGGQGWITVQLIGTGVSG